MCYTDGIKKWNGTVNHIDVRAVKLTCKDVTKKNSRNIEFLKITLRFQHSANVSTDRFHVLINGFFSTCYSVGFIDAWYSRLSLSTVSGQSRRQRRVGVWQYRDKKLHSAGWVGLQYCLDLRAKISSVHFTWVIGAQHFNNFT